MRKRVLRNDKVLTLFWPFMHNIIYVYRDNFYCSLTVRIRLYSRLLIATHSHHNNQLRILFPLTNKDNNSNRSLSKDHSFLSSSKDSEQQQPQYPPQLQQQFQPPQKQQQLPAGFGVLMNESKVMNCLHSVLNRSIDKVFKSHAAGLNEATFINNATSTLDSSHTPTRLTNNIISKYCSENIKGIPRNLINLI